MYLKRGKENPTEIVRKVQRFLGIEADGVFGPMTESAVIDYQKENDLSVDGIVGPQTLLEMEIEDDLVVTTPELLLEDKLKIADVISKFEGAFWTCNKNWEFEGWFDRPKYDYAGEKLHPRDRVNQNNWKPLGWSKYGSDPGHVGLSWGFVQFTQDGGNLGTLLEVMQERYPDLFAETFGSYSDELVTVTTRRGKKTKQEDSLSPTGYARRSPRVQPIGGHDLWEKEWTEKFIAAGHIPEFQELQMEMAIKLYFDSMIRKSAIPYNIHSEAGLAILFGRSVQLGPTGCRKLLDRYLRNKKDLPEYEMFKYLYHKVKDRRWSHRLRKLIYNGDVSFYKRFEVVK